MSFTASIDQIVEENASGLLAKHPSWCRVRLSEVADILNGFPFPSGGFSKGLGMPLLRIRDILRDVTEATFDGPFDPAYAVEPGSLVVGMDGDFNAALWRGAPALLNQRVCKITPNPEFYSRKFLAYLLPGYLKAINSHTSSITVKHLSSKTIADIPLPLPSLAEQTRIVDEVEKQLTRLDSAVSSLRGAQAKVKLYREAVLKAACEGQLVSTEAELARVEGRGYESGESLLKQIYASRGDSEGPSPPARLPEGWSWASVEEICSMTIGFAFKSAEFSSQGVRLLRGENIEPGSLRWKDVRFWPLSRLDAFSELLVKKGDIILAMDRPVVSAGLKIARVSDLDLPCLLVQRVACLRSSDPVITDFVYVALRGAQFINHLQAGQTGTQIPHISGRQICSFGVPFPPHREQERITLEVERRLSILRELERSVELNLLRSERLRNSILCQAFKGELVTNDMDCESASVLLEQIRKSREDEERNGNRREHTRNAPPRRGTGIKPGVSTPGTGTTPTPPKPRRGAGSVHESASAPTGLPDPPDVPSLGLKPQALRPGPAGAEERKNEEETGFLDLPRDAQIDLVWESLLGRGVIEKEEAIRTAAQVLRDQGRAQFQRFRQGGPLYQAIAATLDRGAREGSFDRPRRGHVRALLIDPKDYSPDEWRLCLLSSLDHEAVDEGDALRAAAEWARETLGLEFARLREDGVILRSLRTALETAVRRREVKRVRGTIQKLE